MPAGSAALNNYTDTIILGEALSFPKPHLAYTRVISVDYRLFYRHACLYAKLSALY